MDTNSAAKAVQSKFNTHVKKAREDINGGADYILPKVKDNKALLVTNPRIPSLYGLAQVLNTYKTND